MSSTMKLRVGACPVLCEPVALRTAKICKSVRSDMILIGTVLYLLKCTNMMSNIQNKLMFQKNKSNLHKLMIFDTVSYTLCK